MATTVVNIKKNEPYDVYIGRGRGSIWGNPFVVGADGDRLQVIEKYRRHLKKSPELMAALPSLKGKRLGCFCAPKACHGDVIVEFVEALGKA